MKKSTRAIIIILCLCTLCFSLWKLCEALNDYQQGGEYYAAAADSFVSEGAEAPISVDFAALMELTPEIIGWIYSEGTVINYPILQSDDNSKYLHAAPDGSYLYSGSIYADFRSVPAFDCANTVLYGHHMKDGSMFCSVAKYKDAEYYTEHPELWVLTPDGNYRAHVIAGMTVSAYDEIYDSLLDWEKTAENIQCFISGSSFKSDYEWTEGTPILTLSTCTYEFDGARYVLLCSLEKISWEDEHSTNLSS